MLRLCIDTAYKYLSLSIIKDGEIIASYDEECFKRQSEQVFIILEKLFNESKIKKEDLDSVCVSIGPGSYTGVRIGLTISKVLASIKNIDLYYISTLKLYANNKPKTTVIMNARKDRAYVGIYDEGKCIKEDSVLELKDIDIKDYDVVGDGTLLNKEDKMYKISECFMNNLNNMEKCSNIHHLVPVYLKESESYLK